MDDSAGGPEAGLVGLVILFSYLLILPWRRAHAARRTYRRHEASYLESRVSLATDRVAVENASQRSDFDWKHIGVVADTPHGILFCNRTNQALFWLPQRLFEGNRLRDRVLDLAVLHEVPLRRLR